ncbi:MAG: Transcriptional regulator, TrmB [Candidatus Azambacteria bacterium GW2011_GWA2_42_9]|uniref:Transcriptional regulator, TrmB n=1 Tax=Candidatus Azambacteria bacterium GW2011_GWA2_42_9 TaxID=1618613 RepID=A0A0G1DVR1_9BACT|nr:MAG: Transcriptional regulator, TrmB [Candidatus Azambacteria bacterium GW2011_GWA2_42_9]KKS87848.1 MAG: Transcriptional regulator, TrmB [Parcubacteria group bacterium GW2011_GWC1_43_11]HCM82319.1 hypothetical protein [Patescibacteria group bacterium]
MVNNYFTLVSTFAILYFMLEKYLQEIGLTDKEASIYLALLQVDNASVASMAQKTKIKRPTVYVVLESLLKKGLVSQVQIGKKTHYQAEPPERLETYVERRKIMLDEQSRRLKDIIPQIKSIQRETGERPIVKYFEGREGAVSALEEFFGTDEKGGDAYFFYSRDLLDEIFTKDEKDRYVKIRLQKNIHSKSIYTYKSGSLENVDNADRIKIDADKYPVTCDIAIYKDKVRITTLGDKIVSISIRSKDIADTFVSLFKLVHDKSKGA